MRFIITALALLAACAPAAPASSGGLPSIRDPFFTQIIDDARAAEGQWFFRGDEGVLSACFGAPESECQLSIICEAPTGTLTLIVAEEIAPDQRAMIDIYTLEHSLAVFGDSRNEGLPSVIAVKPPGDVERLGLIEIFSSPSRFAIQAHPLDSSDTEFVRYPWDGAIARVVDACKH